MALPCLPTLPVSLNMNSQNLCACQLTLLQGVDGSFMLVNLPAMRDSYTELKAFVLSSKDGGLYANRGVGAAGALHAFALVRTSCEAARVHQCISRACVVGTCTLLLRYKV